MKQQYFEKFENWFYEYVNGFYGDDELINEMLRLKEDHTRRVCRDMEIVTSRLGLNEQQKLLAGTIALFHDIGRFEQFRKYQTFNDFESINHSGLGIQILREKKILNCLDTTEIKIIEKAIAMHTTKQLPLGMDASAELFAKLIRDADKLDIYYVMIDKMSDYRERPEKYNESLGFPDRPYLTDNVVQAVLENRRVAYQKLKTLSDMILVQLGWVVDINFAVTLKEIKKRRLLERIAEFLPEVPESKKVLDHCTEYMENKIQKK